MQGQHGGVAGTRCSNPFADVKLFNYGSSVYLGDLSAMRTPAMQPCVAVVMRMPHWTGRVGREKRLSV